MQAKNAKRTLNKTTKDRKASSPSGKHKLTPEEARIVRQSMKDIQEGRYTDYSTPQELLEAINNDKL